MYALVDSLALPKGLGASWTSVALGDTQCSTIVTTYSECYFTLTNPYLDGTYVLKLSDISARVAAFTGTFNELLAANGNKTLPTTKGTPTVSSGVSRFRTVFHAGFAVKPFDHTMHPDSELSRDQQIDLLLTRDDTDYTKMSKCVMATVNGLFHRTGVCEHGYVVYEGGRSANFAKANMVGLLSFEHVSNFTTYTIEDSWFKKPLATLNYSDRLYFQAPESLFGKTVFLVFAGFLIPMGDVFSKINDNTFTLSCNRLSVIDRYYIASQLLDIADRFEIDATADGRLPLEQLQTDDFIKRMLTLPQSFLVAFDHPGISIDRELLETLKVPGRWLLKGEPRGLLQTDYGFAPEYNIASDPDGYYVLQAMPQYHTVFTRNTRRRQETVAVTNAIHGAYAGRIADG